MPVLPGDSIADTAARAVALADANTALVRFEFNDVHMLAHPGESALAVKDKFWSRVGWPDSTEGARSRYLNLLRLSALVGVLLVRPAAPRARRYGWHAAALSLAFAAGVLVRHVA